MDQLRTILQNKIAGQLPRVLTLLDKNPYSPTRGCFDRKYWHYKIIDFPSGMQQELVLPLAYAFSTDFPGNRLYKLERVREYLEGIFLYHRRSCHADGSLDDYFPHERAFGATAYALAALTEAALLSQACPEEALESFERSGAFLSQYREPGTLSNHLAIASLALTNLQALTGNIRWKTASLGLVEDLGALQHSEGWFPEYQGCDLGYQTVTVEFLARRYQRLPDERLLGMLSKAVAFLVNFMHPDGSLGGEYGSRNTYNFYPGGFAVMSLLLPQAQQALGYFLKGVEGGGCGYLEDDGVFGHLLSSYVTALRCGEIKVVMPEVKSVSAPSVKNFAGAGLFTAATGTLSLFGSLTKGGVYKLFKEDRLLASDTGFMGRLIDGRLFCQNKPRVSAGYLKDNSIFIKGNFSAYQPKRLGRPAMVCLRIFSLLFGWLPWYSSVMRAAMQRSLVYGRKKLGIGFARTIVLRENEIEVTDEIIPSKDSTIDSLRRTTDSVDTHVVTSDAFQSANLLPWEKISTDGLKGVIRCQKRYA